MQFSFTEDQRMFADGLRELLARECTLGHVRAAWDDRTGSVPGLWDRLTEMGVLAILVPEADGGLGMGLADAVLLCAELGRACVPGPVVEHILASPFTPEATVVAAAERGAVDVVAHAGHADAIVCDAGVLRDIASAPVASLDGGRRLAKVHTGRLTPANHDAERLHDGLAIATAAYLVGLSERMIEIAGDYARQREQFGKPIGSFQAVKHLMANALLQVEFAKAPLYRAAWSWDQHESTSPRDASMAKALANEAAYVTTRATMQVHGAIGYTWEADLQLLMKKAWALMRAHGDTTFHRRRVSASILR